VCICLVGPAALRRSIFTRPNCPYHPPLPLPPPPPFALPYVLCIRLSLRERYAFPLLHLLVAHTPAHSLTPFAPHCAALYPANLELATQRVRSICHTCTALQALLACAAISMLARNKIRSDIKWPLYNALCISFAIGGAIGTATWVRYLLAIESQLQFFSRSNSTSVTIAGDVYTATFLLPVYSCDRMRRYKAPQTIAYGVTGIYNLGVWAICWSLSLCFYSCGQLLVLERLAAFSFPSLRLQITAKPTNAVTPTRPLRLGRALACIVLALVLIAWLCVIAASAALMSVNINASSIRSKQLDAWAFAANDLPRFSSEYKSAGQDYADILKLIFTLMMLQSWSVFLVLFIISTSFAVCSAAAAARIYAVRCSTGLLDSKQKSTLKQLRTQILLTSASVMMSFMLRAAWAGVLAVTRISRINSSCLQQYCHSACQSDGFILGQYLLYDPLSVAVVTIISEPICSILALWGMSLQRKKPEGGSKQLTSHSMQQRPL
jgi:hypothetical protein